MTIPIERSWSIKNTRNFLRSLLDPKETPKVPKSVRQVAYRCLRHFPSDLDIEQAARGDSKVFEVDAFILDMEDK